MTGDDLVISTWTLDDMVIAVESALPNRSRLLKGQEGLPAPFTELLILRFSLHTVVTLVKRFLSLVKVTTGIWFRPAIQPKDE